MSFCLNAFFLCSAYTEPFPVCPAPTSLSAEEDHGRTSEEEEGCGDHGYDRQVRTRKHPALHLFYLQYSLNNLCISCFHVSCSRLKTVHFFPLWSIKKTYEPHHISLCWCFSPQDMWFILPCLFVFSLSLPPLHLSLIFSLFLSLSLFHSITHPLFMLFFSPHLPLNLKREWKARIASRSPGGIPISTKLALVHTPNPNMPFMIHIKKFENWKWGHSEWPRDANKRPQSTRYIHPVSAEASD